eukprot:CAMPEP_0183340702 /NCGR_PEP_ID=MMETSP0164_2-20130417/7161_1 /TAXON_ID=221442 /ORGANISM="Coccolithus pelagicus ssp braarudi, Strain PLY182g" /LENGTH=353 /DNA_ID=CAMNT_0025510877 /DNA_START=10 /DNA_END=1071 /DNA_ORIENTATION=+
MTSVLPSLPIASVTAGVATSLAGLAFCYPSSCIATLASLGLIPVAAVFTLLRALHNECDGPTARARLPLGAYNGKCVWITGASSGLGKEFALQLGKLGAKLVLSARREGALADVRAAIIEQGAPATSIVVLPCDLSDLGALPAAAEHAIQAFGGIDVLINNAGFTQRQIAQRTSFAVDIQMTTVDFLACVCLTKVLLPSMVANGGGLIINISSIAGKIGLPLRTAYCASKFALHGFFDALRAEESGHGIRVTNVCPGSVRTNIARNAVTGDVGQLRGDTDANIEAGLDPSWVCERALAAAACGLFESWLGRKSELYLPYMAHYLPDFTKVQVMKKARALVEQTLAAVEAPKES